MILDALEKGPVEEKAPFQMKTKEEEFELMLDHFFEMILGNSLSVNGSPQKKSLLTSYWDHFKTLKLPTKKNEAYRYVPLRKLYEKSFKPNSLTPHNWTKEELLSKEAFVKKVILKECEDSYLVLVNGHYCKELSNTKALSETAIFITFEEALKTYSSFLTNHLKKNLKDENDPFATLNRALGSEGLFIYLPPKLRLERPLQILHLIDTENKDLMINPKIQIVAGIEAEAEIISSQEILSGNQNFINQVTDFVLEEKATVRYNQIFSKLKGDSWYFEKVIATLKKESVFHSFLCSEGGETVRADYRVRLAGEKGKCTLNALWLLEEKNQFHTHVLIDHEAPLCQSRQLFKGVLSDFAKSSFEGKILVRQAAQKTDAFQLNSHLLLSDETNGYSKPNLEIFADDVKASHGCTFGQLDQEQLFFLKSRGISEEEAKNILIFAFCKEIIDLFTVSSLQQLLIAQAKTYHFKKALSKEPLKEL